jgi:hypothetical protein
MVQPIFHEPTFNEGVSSPDPTGFSTPHPSDNAVYSQIEDLLREDVVAFDTSRFADDAVYSLQDAYGEQGADIVQQIHAAGKIIFHSVGDTGASSSGKYKNEIKVSDQLTLDCHSADQNNRPVFLFQLGDVVYDFGESKYYYDQFYEPFRNYPAPIFAIPGNHDSFIVPSTVQGAPGGDTPLTIFQRNFCATQPQITPEAASLHRTAMTQPGVYFTLDAPFVRILGLFSNALEDPGVISSENGKWPTVPDYQLAFLTSQLQSIKTSNYQGAVILAVHHPPFSYTPPPTGSGSGGAHGSSTNMLRQIDQICAEVGVYPHAILSGHAHNYQRYTRTIQFNGSTYSVPFVVAGDGGHDVTKLVQSNRGQPAQEPNNGADVTYMDISPAVSATGLKIEKHDDTHYGYLRITVDAKQLAIGFYEVGGTSIAQSRYDMVTVDLASHSLVAN